LLNVFAIGEFRFNLLGEIMDVNRLPVNHGPPCGAPTTYGSRHFGNGHWPIVRHALKDISINTPDDSIISLTQTSGILRNYIQDGLNISWRTSDNSQYVARRSLLLQRLF